MRKQARMQEGGQSAASDWQGSSGQVVKCRYHERKAVMAFAHPCSPSNFDVAFIEESDIKDPEPVNGKATRKWIQQNGQDDLEDFLREPSQQGTPGTGPRLECTKDGLGK
eukprot:Skav223861  [mRNA]  locus=scaffold1226:25460:28176:+ [translate_table: standard]